MGSAAPRGRALRLTSCTTASETKPKAHGRSCTCSPRKQAAFHAWQWRIADAATPWNVNPTCVVAIPYEKSCLLYLLPRNLPPRILCVHTPCASGHRNSNNACRVLSVYVPQSGSRRTRSGYGTITGWHACIVSVQQRGQRRSVFTSCMMRRGCPMAHYSMPTAVASNERTHTWHRPSIWSLSTEV